MRDSLALPTLAIVAGTSLFTSSALSSPNSPPPTIPQTSGTLRAFPAAEGFGATATGGRGGEVVHVTTLADAGPGSFRDAVSQSHRLVVFDVGGLIRLKSNVAVSSDITVLGQTAPGDGIALYGRSLSLSGSTNIILRYLRTRQGIEGDKGKCSVNMHKSAHLMLDHVSIQWGRWDCLGITEGGHDITLQHCLIGEGLDPQRFGALIDSVNNITLSHNLWLNNQSRNPKAKGTIQYINNVVYNWGASGLVGGHSGADHQLDVIGNYFIKGPSSGDHFLAMFTATDHVFQQDNLTDMNCDGQLNGRPVVPADFGTSTNAATLVNAAFMRPAIPVTVESPQAAYAKIVAGAGCSLHRDAIDTRLIGQLTSLGKEGKIVHSETEVGGHGELKGGEPAASSLKDGIPDTWKTAHHLDLKDTKLAQTLASDGYTWLEHYASEIVAERP
jgi:pectate lyase